MDFMKLHEANAWDDVIDHLMRFFNYDQRKVFIWLNTKNPMLGNITPTQMKLARRAYKLRQVVESELQDNRV